MAQPMSMQCEDVDIAGFVSSQLDAAQTSAVAEHLEQCAECRDRLRLVLEIRSRRSDLEQLAYPGRRWPVYLWPVAAGLVLVGLIGYWTATRPADIRALAVTTPYPLVPPQLRSPVVDEAFTAAARAYSEQDWPAAEQGFRQLLVLHPEDYDAAFYLANVLYTRSSLEEAERLLLDLAGRRPEDGRVQWYLANIRLRQGDAAGARARLESVAGSGAEFSKEAAGLLGRLPK